MAGFIRPWRLFIPVLPYLVRVNLAPIVPLHSFQHNYTHFLQSSSQLLWQKARYSCVFITTPPFGPNLPLPSISLFVHTVLSMCIKYVALALFCLCLVLKALLALSLTVSFPTHAHRVPLTPEKSILIHVERLLCKQAVVVLLFLLTSGLVGWDGWDGRIVASDTYTCICNSIQFKRRHPLNPNNQTLNI